MPTKDSSCLQGKEGNASVDSKHTVHGGLAQHWSRLRATQQDCKWRGTSLFIHGSGLSGKAI